MKTFVLQENFNKGLNLISRVISSKPPLPILSNVLLSTEEGKLKLTATNLEIGINFWLPAKKIKSGKFTIPAKDLTEFVSSLPPGKINLEQKQERLTLVSGAYKATFNGMPATEFPEVPSLKGKKSKLKISKKFELEVKQFVRAVNAVGYAAAVDETRPVLTGIHLSSLDSRLQLVATDGYRLGLKKIKIGKKIDISTLIIPARALLEVVKIIEAEAEAEKDQGLQTAITEETKQTVFSYGNAEVVARLIEGEYPDFSKIIPEKGESEAVIDKEEFNKAIRAASIFARRSANIVKLAFSSSGLTVQANAPEIGENEIKLPIKYDGEKVEIAFNCRFLQDFLNSFDQDVFILGFSGSLKPGLFTGEKDASLLHVIMPVRLQEA